MVKSVIDIEGISKQYQIGLKQERYRTFREALVSAAKAPLDRFRKLAGGVHDDSTFWALKDVSFDVEPGEVVGIIGRNGAGKSTLLKILSRITEPTEGEVRIRGRVGSLLEVGTGFHNELTGRENVFLNGSILGMNRREIERKFDEIVDFSGVEKFLDTPVKHYSSGMKVRLGFAVAAHLEPEILIVDEVLAVGDADFQKKCLGKMSDVATSGRTVLFVSHNMAAVRSLCTRAVQLEKGEVGFNGDPEVAISGYMQNAIDGINSRWERDRQKPPSLPLSVDSIEVRVEGEQPRHTLHIQASMTSHELHPPAMMAIDILDASGTWIMQALPSAVGLIKSSSRSTHCEIEVALPPMIPGIYSVGFWVGPDLNSTFDHCRDVVTFQITHSPTPERTCPHHPNRGYVVPESKFVRIQQA
ncbi:MAG: ABC transporter ATP-binding protein [Planctomycetaceae bacterium]